MGDLAERLTYYKTKCSQNLNRVRLSHILALETLRDEQFLSQAKYKDLVSASFTDTAQDEILPKMHVVLHKQHLLALKIHFELFLNRILSAVWKSRFKDLAPTISGLVSLKELAASIVETGESSADVQEFIIDKVVRNQGLGHFEKVLKNVTQIDIQVLLKNKDPHYWPQIRTAFEARHLVEHRDGKVDERFRKAVAPFWPNSSWGKRVSLKGLKKANVDEVDVIATHDAMLHATELLTNEVLSWSPHRAG